MGHFKTSMQSGKVSGELDCELGGLNGTQQ